jgi:hypothetical protein
VLLCFTAKFSTAPVATEAPVRINGNASSIIAEVVLVVAAAEVPVVVEAVPDAAQAARPSDTPTGKTTEIIVRIEINLILFFIISFCCQPSRNRGTAFLP